MWSWPGMVEFCPSDVGSKNCGGYLFFFRDLNMHYYGRILNKLKGEYTMLFEMKFKVVEIRESGATITHYLKGKRWDVKKDVEVFKRNSKKYEMIGKEGMIVWA